MTEVEQQVTERVTSLVNIVRLVMTAEKPDGTKFSKVCTAHQLALTGVIEEVEAALKELDNQHE